jgi:glycerate 2-kinase
MNLKDIAREVFLTSVNALHLDAVMREQVTREGNIIRIREQRFDMQDFTNVFVIAIGKAGNVMLENLLQLLQPVLTTDQVLKSILVSTKPITPDPRIQQFRGDHPIPGETSAQAAQAVLELLEEADDQSLVFFLISGGASSMVEEPLNREWSLADVESFYRGLVHSGLAIAMMNALRKHASRTKGGRLAVAASPATQCSLLISDVPDDLVDVIGSGPSLPDSSTIADCRSILTQNAKKIHMQQHIHDWFSDADIAETPKFEHPAFQKSSWHVLLSNRELVEKASAEATAQGLFVQIDNACDDWDYEDAARYLLTKLEKLRQKHDRVCLLTGGELSVKITPNHGIGGRNQQFVLACARLLAEKQMKATVLSAGSDGVDGNSIAAGAVADETTFSRAAAMGMNALSALENFNSYSIFKALEDDIVTGPTGNNLRDLRILLSCKS